MSKRAQTIVFTILFVVAFLIGGLHYANKLTYLERCNYNTTSDTYYPINQTGDVVRQEFTMPYQLFQQIGIQIETVDRINNSRWRVSIVDLSDDSVVCSQIIDAGVISNHDYYRVKFDRHNRRVRQGDVYELLIEALDVNDYSAIGFCMSNEQVDGATLYVNDVAQAGTLCLQIYGGDVDYWWLGFWILIMVWVLLMFALYLRSGARGLAFVRENLMLQSLLTAFVFFMLWVTFVVNDGFTDEFDNVRAGMEIARGAVLYRDYVTQHMPFPSYLCAVFALLGASSVAQMRLLYYVLQSAIWGGMYYRHAGYYGRRTMLILPVMEAIFIVSVVQPQSYMIMPDGIQGVCMAVLGLEAIRYLHDGELSIGRCVIISLCVWCSFGCAFVCAVAIGGVFLVFVMREVQTAGAHMSSLRDAVERYAGLVIALVIPPVAAIGYFAANHALVEAYDLTYRFNREVYAQFVDGFGDNLLQPAVDGVYKMFERISEDVEEIIGITATSVQIIGLIVIFIALITMVQLVLHRQYATVLLMAALVFGNATRGYKFHGIAAWYIIIEFIVLYRAYLIPQVRREQVALLTCVGAFLLTAYVMEVRDNLLARTTPVDGIETAVVELTEEGDQILIDTYAVDSIYLLYKNRYPVNRCTYFLQWYMAWYESELTEQLLTSNSKVVIYNPDKDYTVAFKTTLMEHYTQSDQFDRLWIANE